MQRNKSAGKYLFQIMEESEHTHKIKHCIENMRVDGGSQDEIEVPFEITSDKYLKYAEDDLKSQLSHRYINCLSNVKRAIHCQIDSLFYIFGLYEHAQQKKWDFPKKVALLNQIGVITPRILKKINKNRNLLEHEYLDPSPDGIEDALDVAELFIGYTDRLLRHPFTELSYCNDAKTHHLVLKLSPLEKLLIVTEYIDTAEGGCSKVEMKLTAGSAVYLDYLTLWVRATCDVK
jgi:hypothetical protein